MVSLLLYQNYFITVSPAGQVFPGIFPKRLSGDKAHFLARQVDGPFFILLLLVIDHGQKSVQLIYELIIRGQEHVKPSVKAQGNDCSVGHADLLAAAEGVSLLQRPEQLQ